MKNTERYDEIFNNILEICTPEKPYFYVDSFEDREEKEFILQQILMWDELREHIGLKSNAAFKIAHISASISDENADSITRLITEHNQSEKEYKATLNLFNFDNEVDEIVFDLIIYDNLTLEDLNLSHINFEKIKTPRLMLFKSDSDIRI